MVRRVSIHDSQFTIHFSKEVDLAEKRIYEVVFIVDPDANDEEVMRLSETLQKIVTSQDSNVTKTEMMGRRQLAYEIGHKKEGIYVLLEIEGSGREIAELERRMRVNDRILRYITVRVDEDRRRAEKFKERRAAKAAKKANKSKSRGSGSKPGAVFEADEAAA
jgi:small subunit ribosomal protein S6